MGDGRKCFLVSNCGVFKIQLEVAVHHDQHIELECPWFSGAGIIQHHLVSGSLKDLLSVPYRNSTQSGREAEQWPLHVSALYMVE